MKFRSWGGTAQCEILERWQPHDEDELRGMLRHAARQGRAVKLVGAVHSWSDIACTDGYQINLDRMRKVISVDHRRKRVTVQAGIRLRELLAELSRHRLSLPVLGSILEQSVAGAISTATHGSAPGLRNLSAQIAALRIMLADGSVREIDENQPELLRACRVSLGALGVITQVTLDCVPAFALREVAGPIDFDEAVETLHAIVESAPYVKLWWLPHTQKVQVYRCFLSDARVPAGPPPLGMRVAQWLDAELVNRRVFDGLLRFSANAPAYIPLMNRTVRAFYFRKTQRTGASTALLPVAMPPVHRETEYALPLRAATPALLKLRELIDGANPGSPRLRVNFPAELRFVAADDAWLSPMHGTAQEVFCCLGAYTADGPDHERYFAEFESLAQSLGGRPHWGKSFTATGNYLAPVYPRYRDFAALRREWDPEGRFLNAYLRRLFSPEIGV
jgi:FAD/FMN-containing dehydrogenase